MKRIWNEREALLENKALEKEKDVSTSKYKIKEWPNDRT